MVFTSLPGPPEVEQVATGAEGLLHGVRAGSAVFDLSTNAPALVRRLDGLFAARGAHVLDAPVSGGPVGAKTRRLAIWVGGERAAVRPVPAAARGDGRPALLRGPGGRGRGGQARAQLRQLHDPRGAGRGVLAWA